MIELECDYNALYKAINEAIKSMKWLRCKQSIDNIDHYDLIRRC